MALPTLIKFVADTDADADEVNSNFDIIASRFNYGIMDEDINDLAGITGTKLSDQSGKRIPTSRLENNAVDDRVLGHDISQNANRAVGTDHIKDASVTLPKLAAGIGQAILVTESFTITFYASAYSYADVVLTVPRSKVLWDLVACYVKDVTNTGAVMPLSVWVSPNDTGANWSARIYGDLSGSGGTLYVYGTLVMSFQAR
jgi:hypothetical protein